MDDLFGVLDAWMTRFDGHTLPELDALVEHGQAQYDDSRAVWIIQGPDGPYEVRNVDAELDQLQAAAGDVAGVDTEIDHAIIRYDAGQAPANPRDGVIYRALAEADASEGTTTRWREQLAEQLAAGPREWYLIRYAAGDDTRAAVTAFHPDAARHTARRMSGTGEQVDVVHVASNGSQHLIGSYRDREQLAPARQPDPWPDEPRPLARVPAVADAAGPPVLLQAGDPRATPRQFPGGISPLPRTAASGGPIRPAWLLYPDGELVECRPAGNNGPVQAGVAAGVTPAEGSLAPGWLQVVSRADGSLAALHPALVSPKGIDPYSWLPPRQRQRFGGGFDPAEASGQDAALLQAIFVDPGDRIRTDTGEVREATGVSFTGGPTVRIVTAGNSDPLEVGSREWVTVMIPARHPAEHRPDAARLFAPALPEVDQAGHDPRGLGLLGPDGRAARRLGNPDLEAHLDTQLGQLEQTLARLREHGHPAGPQATPAADAGWPASISMTQALRRGPYQARHAAAASPHRDLPAQPGWQVSVRTTGAMQGAQDRAAGMIRGLSQSPIWRRLRAVTMSARRLASDAGAARLRFSDPAGALRVWKAAWGRACELTGDLAAAMMTRFRQGTRPWYAARTLHHAAAEGVAHAYGWLPRGDRLPVGSYEAPSRYKTRTWVRADAATRLHQADAGRLDQLVEFPAALADATPRRTPGRRDRQRAARTAAARAAQVRTYSTRPGPG